MHSLCRSTRVMQIACLVAVSLAAVPASAQLVSGEFIPCGAPDGVGPLAAEKIVNHPVGAADVFGRDYPDLFVMSGSRFYPGLLLFPWESTSDDGVPVFGEARTVATPGCVKPGNPGTIFDRNGEVHALWVAKGDLIHLTLDKATLTFKEVARRKLSGLPRGPHAVAWLPDAEGDGGSVVVAITDGKGYGPPMDGFTSSRDPRYDPYDGAGIWRGGFSYVTLYAVRFDRFMEEPVGEPRRIVPTDREVLQHARSLTVVDVGNGPAVVSGSIYGPIYHFAADDSGAFESGHMIADDNGIALRHPSIKPTPVAYPDADGRWCNLLAGGEGAVHFYRFLDRFTPAGQPVYAPSTPALQRDADLYAGTLPVPNAVDWDGDGLVDIVAGNSEGFVLFCRNVGTADAPRFLSPVPLEAGGDIICVQPGYSGSIQGPGEARWGYTCPTVADWNRDGLPDVLLSGATAQHHVYFNVGTRTEPKFDHARPVYCDGLELHGTWRVKPGVAEMAGRMAYVALDDDDEFHLYWQIDVYNLENAGKLRLESGAVIGANFLKSGGTGRIKISLVDWDRDGRTDLLIGTPRHASIPDPDNGLPQSLGLPGSGVLLLRNRGTDAEPVFAHPETLKFKGADIFFGQHACGPTPFGDPAKPGLIVSVETGHFRYFAPEDIGFGKPD
ncbi:MAG: VCBS repeat-containing protein [bacterium]|nr:VCBS repeat-containing protein [bacterium]